MGIDQPPPSRAYPRFVRRPGGSSSSLQESPATYIEGRSPNRTYLSKSFPLGVEASRDYGEQARFAMKVFDERDVPLLPGVDELERTEMVVYESPAARKQVRVQVAREAGAIRELVIEEVANLKAGPAVQRLLRLDRESAGRLIDFVKALEYVPAEGDDTVRLDDDLIRDVFANPDALQRIYSRDPSKLRQLIETDASASDVAALAHRRRMVEVFRQLLSDDAYFDKAAERLGGKEKVWQRYLEDNPWVLGVGLAGQLMTSWDEEKLEQVVAGFNITKDGKRTDALLRTAGQIRSLVLAEIKHHRTPLLGTTEYRSGVWRPSDELGGGVAQSQQTALRASEDLEMAIPDVDDEGARTGEHTYLVAPRSFLIIGSLDQLRGAGGGVVDEKYRSFEVFRRSLREPEVLTFDELLARAEWHVTAADQAAAAAGAGAGAGAGA